MVINFIRSCSLYLTFRFGLLILPSLGFSQNTNSNYHWNNNGIIVKLNLIPNQVINFDDDNSTNAIVKSLKLQKLKKLTGGGHLLELSQSSYSNFLTHGNKLIKMGSPLFKEGGMLKALPGGIIVSFKEGISENEIKSLCDVYNLKLNKKYSIDGEPAVWFIDTAAGLESLRLSNIMVENHSNLVLKSRPNFWQPINTKELKLSDIKINRVK